MRRIMATIAAVESERDEAREKFNDLTREWFRSREERDAARAEVEKLRAEAAALHKRLTTASTPHWLDRRHRCKACGKLTRNSTAGCDHCDLEDK